MQPFARSPKIVFWRPREDLVMLGLFGHLDERDLPALQGIPAARLMVDTELLSGVDTVVLGALPSLFARAHVTIVPRALPVRMRLQEVPALRAITLREVETLGEACDELGASDLLATWTKARKQICAQLLSRDGC